MGPKTGGIVNQLVQACGGNRDRARELLDEAEGLESPRGRIMWHIAKLKEAAEEEKRLYRGIEGCAGDYVEPATDWDAEYRGMGVSL